MLKKCKYLLSCLLIGLGLLSFGYCDNIYSDILLKSYSVGVDSPHNFSAGDCFQETSSSFAKVDVYDRNGNFISHGKGNGSALFCVNFDGVLQLADGINSSVYVGYYNLVGLLNSGIFSGYYSCPTCPECEECQTCSEVNTGDILSGSCDTNYCVENDLCPVASNFSQLYINNIEHDSQPIINIGIPDYITWDYSVGSGVFDVYVGSGYDVDYINSIIDINSYRPTSSDFTSVFVSGLTLIMPYIIFVLFLVFMRKLIKRIFK